MSQHVFISDKFQPLFILLYSLSPQPPILLEKRQPSSPQSFKAAESKDEIGEEIRLAGAVMDVLMLTLARRKFQNRGLVKSEDWFGTN